MEAAEMTFQEFAEAFWMPYLDRKGVKPSTRRSYECALKGHILPFFGSLKLREIVPIHIEDFLHSLTANHKLSPKSTLNLFRQVQGIFSLALDNDLIHRSPVREKHKPVAPRSKKPIWTREQVRAIVNEVPAQFRPLFVTLILTGLRAGELLGLQWRHVDFERGELRIEQSLWNRQIVTPKTEKSVDSIPMSPMLRQALEEQHRTTAHRSVSDFVFGTPDGSSLCPDVLRRDVLYPALDRLRIPRAKGASGFHAFRHTSASVMEQETGRLKAVQEFLRHGHISTTGDIYVHPSSESKRAAVESLEKAFFGDLFPIVPKIGNKTSDTAIN
jgi:integrase